MNTEQHLCKTAMTIERRRAIGRAVSTQDLSFLKRHLTACPRCRVDGAMIATLENDLPGPALGDLAKRRLFDRVIAEARRQEALPDEAPARSRHWQLPAMGVGLAASVAVAIYLISGPSPTPAGDEAHRRAAQAPNAPMENASPLITESSGPLVPNRGTLARRPSPEETRHLLEPTEERRTINLPTGIRLRSEPLSDVSLSRMDTEMIEVTLTSGTLLASVDPGRKGPRFSVRTPYGTAEVTGTIFRVAVGAATTEVEVLRGHVLITRSNGRTESLLAGYSASLAGAGSAPIADETRAERLADAQAIETEAPTANGPLVDLSKQPLDTAPLLPAIGVGLPGPQPRVAPPVTKPAAGREPAPLSPNSSVRTLLDEARRLRIERRWAASADIYEALIVRYPSTDEAMTALVTLGDLYLNALKRPNDALLRYDAYLRSGKGTLGQESLLGKADALLQLGRSDEARVTLKRFLRDYPNALQAAEVRRKIDSLGDK